MTSKYVSLKDKTIPICIKHYATTGKIPHIQILDATIIKVTEENDACTVSLIIEHPIGELEEIDVPLSWLVNECESCENRLQCVVDNVECYQEMQQRREIIRHDK